MKFRSETPNLCRLAGNRIVVRYVRPQIGLKDVVVEWFKVQTGQLLAG